MLNSSPGGQKEVCTVGQEFDQFIDVTSSCGAEELRVHNTVLNDVHSMKERIVVS